MAQKLSNVYLQVSKAEVRGLGQMHCATCFCASDTGGHSFKASLSDADKITVHCGSLHL